MCGWMHWQHIEEEVRRRTKLSSLSWVHFRSQWGKERSSMLGLDQNGAPRVFVVVEPPNRETLTDRLPATRSFRVATCIDSFCEDRWSVRSFEPLPRLHRPARWDASKIQRVSEEFRAINH